MFFCFVPLALHAAVRLTFRKGYLGLPPLLPLSHRVPNFCLVS